MNVALCPLWHYFQYIVMPIYHFLCQRDVDGPVDDDWFEYDNEGNSGLYEDV